VRVVPLPPLGRAGLRLGWISPERREKERVNMQCRAEVVDGARCILEEGHEEKHHKYEVPLPPDVGRLVASLMDHEEEQKARRDDILKKMKRTFWYQRFILYLMIGALVANVSGAIYYFTSGG
jgi:hypothetical protein